ncbi:hypothetical protein SAMN05216228_1002215 [Rhizobium tibeticum]|uniref:TfoX N-terminal domain-containing protein n=1 Tax=Rhizobium tibeticum TaxID=501024 RepID=A0A1H8DWB2_9HYPH|nr:hypothetical protein RTCCBAU85039_1036 [Rhizobium tibeticum]SEN11465.1 hypothetical protein SAMN05216228_1002215 [Rhizobium tibeticum]
MARDVGLEELLREELGTISGLSEKPMFGGRAFLLDGNLLCGAREDGMLVRLGKGKDGWALGLPGAAQMLSAAAPCRVGSGSEPTSMAMTICGTVFWRPL